MKKILTGIYLLLATLGTHNAISQRINKDFSPAFTSEAYISYTKAYGDKIVVVGDIDKVNEQLTESVVILNRDGSLHKAAHPEGISEEGFIQAYCSTDSLMVFRNNDNLNSFLFDYKNETSINLNSSISAADFTPENKLVTASYNQASSQVIVKRYDDQGNEDSSFQRGAVDGNISYIKVLSSGEIIITGDFSSYNGEAYNNMVKLDVTGAIVPEFNIGTGASNIEKVMEGDAGKIFVLGYFSTFNNANIFGGIVRLHADGSVDNTFITNDIDRTFYNATDIKMNGDGDYYIAGQSKTSLHAIIKVNNTGSILNEFSQVNTENYNSEGSGRAFIELTDTDEVLLFGTFNKVGNTTKIGAAKFSVTGELTSDDLRLQGAALIKSAAVLSDGNIVVVGKLSNIGESEALSIAKINKGGTVDPNFVIDPSIKISGTTKVIAQNDDKLLVAGVFEINNELKSIIRLLPDGSLDDSFNTDYNFNWTPTDMAYDSKNEAVYMVYPNGSTIIKYDLEGTRDLSFTIANKFPEDFTTTAIFTDINDEFFVGGYTSIDNGLTGGEIYKMDSNGDLVEGFVINNIAQSVTALKRISADRVIFAGGSVRAGSSTDPNPLFFMNNKGEIIDQNTFAVRGNDEIRQNLIIDIILNKDSTEAYLLGIFAFTNQVATNQIAHIYLDGGIDEHISFKLNGSAQTGFLDHNTDILYTFGQFSEAALESRFAAASFFTKNYIPEIKSLINPIEIEEDTPTTLSADQLNITDLDDAIFDLIIAAGENYSVSEQNELIPANNYNGTLNVNIQITDQKDTSSVFVAAVSVLPVNDAPALISNTNFTVMEDSTLEISLADFELEDPDSEATNFSFSLFAGDHYTVEGQTILPEENYFGDLAVAVSFSDGVDESEIYNVAIAVSPVNDAPIIIGLNNELILAGITSYQLSIADFIVEDTDNEATDFTLTLLEGENYTADGLTVSTENDFIGTLNVTVVVSDGLAESEPFEFSVEVTQTLSNKDISAFQLVSLYPNPAHKLLNVVLNDPYRGALIISIHDMSGKTIYSTTTQKQAFEFNYSVPVNGIDQGLYLIKIHNEKLLLTYSAKLVINN